MSDIILIDYSWCKYRAKFSFIDLEVNKKGVVYKTGILYGLYYYISDIVYNYPDADIYLCIDGKSEKASRVTSYKAHRDHQSDSTSIDVSPNKVAKILTLIPKVQIAFAEMEADDTIAFLAASLDKDRNKIIYGNDLDLRQIISDNYNITCAKEFIDGKFVMEDEDYVKRNYGLKPEAIAMFKAITGDSSDNIKGIYRFSKEMAKSISNSFPDIKDLENNYINSKFHTRHDRAREVIKQNIDLIRINYYLTKIDPIKIPTIYNYNHKYDRGEAFEFLEYYEAFKVKASIEELIKKE